MAPKRNLADDSSAAKYGSAVRKTASDAYFDAVQRVLDRVGYVDIQPSESLHLLNFCFI